ncbi:hypothetical protein LUZ63_019368 [Rhynchospora breviuscula]|uniref:WRKY19-like zinc finger domain-containing protein n=1 Tax=Rhynchospora breviuscula TaxID=2022672 RepID=A0A9Q0C665_9POAL|nr:hypothetical protein LUZ63_019368 [Rhynchospora breviuscula]
MDGVLQNKTHLNSAFPCWNQIQPGSGFNPDASLRLDPRSNSCISSSQGIKRKWGVADGEMPALALGLGPSPSSSDTSKLSSPTVCTISSTKETDEESSMDLGLNFDIFLGQNENLHPQKRSFGREFDLNLSLTTGPHESEITALVEQPSFALSKQLGENPKPTCWTFNSHLAGPSPGISTSTGTNAGTSLYDSNVDPGLIISVSDLKSTLVNPPRMSSAVPCASGTSSQKRSTNAKMCQFPGCTKGARGSSGRCISHGGGRRCQRPGCQKGAEGKTIFCKAHGGGRRCSFLGCTKSAEGKTDHCIAHGGGRRCNHVDGCTRAARGKSGLCIRHGGGKRCLKEGCTRSAEGQSGLCISHGGGRRCQFPECTKGAQGSTKFCKAHGGGKRCTFFGCTKGAEGSTLYCKGHGGGKRCNFQGGGVCPKSVHGGTQFCVAHGGGKRCAALACTKSARGRTEFCVRHGGGKRCKELGCGKSAQGSTDFCKAHGGGKRCAWGQIGHGYGDREPSCDKLARSKTGLCSNHGALVQDHCVHGGRLGPVVKPEKNEVMNTGDASLELDSNVDKFFGNGGFVADGATQHGKAGVAEGRVHGGNLMALLSKGQANAGAATGASEDGINASGATMLSWI